MKLDFLCVLFIYFCFRVAGVKNMKIFENVAWDKLLEQPAPFQPQPSDETDTTYFEGENNIYRFSNYAFVLGASQSIITNSTIDCIAHSHHYTAEFVSTKIFVPMLSKPLQECQHQNRFNSKRTTA